jgi:hypothetical protein
VPRRLSCHKLNYDAFEQRREERQLKDKVIKKKKKKNVNNIKLNLASMGILPKLLDMLLVKIKYSTFFAVFSMV